MAPWSLILFAVMAFVLGTIKLALAISSNQLAEPSVLWFFLGMLAAWTGSALLGQQRRLRDLETEVRRIQAPACRQSPEEG